jgi:hypothetical protein
LLSKCSKDDPAGPGPARYNIPSPAFIVVDSIILLNETETVCTLKINAADTLQYFYTTDGSVPDNNSSVYDSRQGIVLSEGEYIIKIVAYYKGIAGSVVTRAFTVTHILPVSVLGINNKTNYTSPVTISILNPDNNLQYISKLNSGDIDLLSPVTISEPGFYSLAITSKKNNIQRTDTFLFVILDPSRNETEWGLKTWVPAPFPISTINAESVEVFYPKRYITGINMPFIIKTTLAGELKPLYLPVNNSVSNSSFNIKRGIGSINIFPSVAFSEIVFTCGGKSINLPVTFENATWTILGGTITSYHTGINARIRISSDITIPAGDTLLIEEGSIIVIDETVDINNFGFINITGSAENPVVITCFKPDGFWGGFLSKGSDNGIEISYSIICQSGYHTTPAYQWGHAQRQALFYLEGSVFKITKSFLTDHIGQVFYSTDAVIQIDSILVQRAKTGGQLNTSQVFINHSIFTDFPDDSYIFKDNDNDALYISHCDATVRNSTFMFAKDDGIDSGENEGGTVNIDHCRFEANFHEGIALSSKKPAVRNHNITNCVVTNCGQGIELGFSSPYHNVNIDHCLLYKNGIGLRYGDNYDWSLVEGKMNISNSISVNNLNKDIWNMVRQLWSPKLENMTFTEIYISQYSDQYPGLPLIIDFDDYPE